MEFEIGRNDFRDKKSIAWRNIIDDIKFNIGQDYVVHGSKNVNFDEKKCRTK